MKKTYKYTVRIVCLAVLFSVGFMAGMQFILQARVQKLLSENGEIKAQSARVEWQRQESLSVEQIEEVVRRCGEDGQWAAYHLVNGQIVMEDAVKAGKMWLFEMGLEDNDWYEKSQVWSVDATLGTVGQEEKELYYGFWKVRFQSRDIGGILYVNAADARVWRADLITDEAYWEQRGLSVQMPYWKLKNFAELLGVTPFYRGAVRNAEGTEAAWDIADSGLCARMEFDGTRKEEIRICMKLAMKEADEIVEEEAEMQR